MGDELAVVGGPTLLWMILLSVILSGTSYIIWLRRSEPRKWQWLHVVLTKLFVQAAWGVTWLFYGLGFWNGFIAPIFMLLKMSVKLLPLLLKKAM